MIFIIVKYYIIIIIIFYFIISIIILVKYYLICFRLAGCYVGDRVFGSFCHNFTEENVRMPSR